MTAQAPEAPATTAREHRAAENAAAVLLTDTAGYRRTAARHFEAMGKHMNAHERADFERFLASVERFEDCLSQRLTLHHAAADRADRTHP